MSDQLYRRIGSDGETRTSQYVPVEPDYEAAQRVYEWHVNAAMFDMVLSKSGGKAIVDAALGLGDSNE